MGHPTQHRHLALIVGTIPIGVVGLLLRHAVEGASSARCGSSPSHCRRAQCAARAGTRPGHHQSARRDPHRLRAERCWRMVPGVSRWESPMLGDGAENRRDAAARFSFLLSIPAVGAAGIFELPRSCGTPSAARRWRSADRRRERMSGYASIAWLLKFLRTRSTMPFAPRGAGRGHHRDAGFGPARLARRHRRVSPRRRTQSQ